MSDESSAPHPSSTSTSVSPPPLTRYQIFIIAVLAFLQFTIVVDFMILAPLGALLMRDLQVPAARFGLLVSAYAFSAGISGLLTAGFADRFDRKRLLLFFYTGFMIGTLLCGLAPTYHFLLGARIVTGLFGGVVGSIGFAIVADLFPLQMRGRVMGFVQTSFAASQVLGVPVGLLLSNHWGWHAPFLGLVAVGTPVAFIMAARMQPIAAHLVDLAHPADAAATERRPENPLRHLFQTVSRPAYLKAYAATMLLVTGGFMLMPFGSAFTVNNVKIPVEKLPLIYLVTGLCSIVAGPLVGRLADRWGKYALFCAGSVLSMVMVVVYTHLGVTPLSLVIVVNALLFIGVTSRIITASALTSAVPDLPSRGAFMAVNASVQQFSGGLAAGAAGLIVEEMPDGTLRHYDTLGFIVVGAMIFAMAMLYGIHRAVAAKVSDAADAANATAASSGPRPSPGAA
jgi:predicted MFS family arabinose efflux permease